MYIKKIYKIISYKDIKLRLYLQITALDPTRLLLTLGASPGLADSTHGNTALHWAILARNTLAINTLVLQVCLV